MSSRSLDDLRAEIQPLAREFVSSVADNGIDMLITCTLRSNYEQDALYQKGRTVPGPIVTNAPAGQSAHNYGLAMDIVPLVNGKPDWNGADPVWQRIGALGQAAGLVWLGAPSSKFFEQPHFELPDWRTVAGI